MERGPDGKAPPDDLRDRHVWEDRPHFELAGAANVKARYGASGDGTTDDYAALQRAIDENEIVFLPKGYHRISRTLTLRPDSKLIGVARHLSQIVPLVGQGDFANAASPQPAIRRADDPSGTAALDNIGVDVPHGSDTAYWIAWRTGERSVIGPINLLVDGAPGSWHIVDERTAGGDHVMTAPFDRLVLYRRGFHTWSEVP